MKKTTRLIVIIAVLGLVALTIFKLASNKKEVTERVYHANINAKALVQVDTVKESSFGASTTFLGTFSPSREVSIASETSGKVITVGIKEGSQVVAGTLIAHLNDAVLQAQFSSAKANLANAATTLKRYNAAPTGVTQLQMDNAHTQVLTNQAQIEQLQRQIDQYTIKAPFAGVITARNFDLGAIVSPGTTLATLIDIATLKLEISVPEKYVMQFKKDMSLNVKTDVYPNTIFKGAVDYISSNADASHNYTVKVLVTNTVQSPLRAGMYGNVIVGSSALQNAISIPRSALLGSSQKPQVYVAQNGVAKLRDIEIGASNETDVQVTNGLKVNDIVITGGLVNLTGGTKIDVK
ncbi:efflux RND transporter periplasmic adaptor subunit [Mucilaginibacter sp. OK283]|jgi:RND family efflux transporter MFP subunit|uniref:efflux RND transporter periplasmic adaptor subunit n=1 Tax=Mucilaginibacter sp. OK283 TaxID=1881049 RepID=UPI0008BD6424|nr:efflux RND transporter periplasmic adaptor subunit [Mucilaginibacter sp. OK283]SEP40401.1 RND family efflux transporter, MFP subunit [Mucilaginibacter sp. OK283]